MMRWNVVAAALCACVLTAHAAEDEWIELFDGKSLSGWTTLDGKPAPAGWVAQDGVLKRVEKAADIYTQREFTDFVLEFEFRIAEGGNSGVKYRMAKHGGQYLGLEYQVFGDVAKTPAKGSTAALYDLIPPNDKKRMAAASEWNSARIVARGSHIEHWLNGEKVVDVDLNSEEYKKALAASKFKAYSTFGSAQPGRIMLQEHGSAVEFRKLRIKPM